MTVLESIREQALALSDQEKWQLIRDLEVSMDPELQRVEKLWADEADRRVEAYNRGEIASVSLEEVKKRFGFH